MRNEDENDEEDERIFQQLRRKPGAKPVVKPTIKATRRYRRDSFVQIPWWWAQAAAKATRMPGLLVCIELLHRSWKAKSLTFSLPNRQPLSGGASRDVKRRVLRDLETAGLIVVTRRHGKSPQVTLVVT